jgi:uncharacterized membrane protein SpoIIM required for sporulation
MAPNDFINRKKASWERLAHLLDRAGGGLAALSAAELHELGRLYRQATSDLAVARRDFAQHPVSAYLNGLVARGHGAIYREGGGGPRKILTFFTQTFPQVFRATWVHTFVAFLMFLLPAIAAFVITAREPERAAILVPGSEMIVEAVQAGDEWWLRINEQGRARSSAEIMTNNIGVAIRAFAGGIFLGVYTLYILAFNGLLIGVVAGAAQHFGFAANLWGFIAAHGVLELSVIFIAGGAGLQIGWAIIHPGLLTRRTALVVAARRAVLLLLGCIPIFVLAGIIEGFISPSPLPVIVKISVAIISGIALLIYLVGVGRTPERDGMIG